MFFVGLAEIILTAAGIFLIARTLIHTRAAAISAHESAATAKASLVASQRPWLAVHLVSPNPKPIKFDKNGASLQMTVGIKNVGSMPATNVTWHAWLVPAVDDMDVSDEQFRRCNELRGLALKEGPTIFPGETWPSQEGGWPIQIQTSWEEMDAIVAPEQRASIGAFLVLGCIDYAVPSDPGNHHQTGFIYLANGVRIAVISEEHHTTRAHFGTLENCSIALKSGAD